MVPKKILVAEDDLDDQSLFYYFLENRKDIVLMPIVSNGAELIDALGCISNTSDLPDFIVLDQNMPKKNGVQTLRLLKETTIYSHIPVVIYSTYIDPTLEKMCIEIGAAALVTKPITAEGYNEMINTFLKAIK